MHIAEGVLSGSVLAAGALLAAAGTGLGLKRMKVEDTPKTAMLASAFFVASLIHVPVGPSNAHLVLNGLAGILLGWTVFPALLTALVLQAVLFQFGGLTVLGVNTVIMALPGVLAAFLFAALRRFCRRPASLFALAAALGGMTVALSGLLLTAALALTGREFLGVAAVVAVAHLPVVITDGLVTGAALSLVAQVRPDLLPPAPSEPAP